MPIHINYFSVSTSSLDSRYVIKSGDTMSGGLTIAASTAPALLLKKDSELSSDQKLYLDGSA